MARSLPFEAPGSQWRSVFSIAAIEGAAFELTAEPLVRRYSLSDFFRRSARAIRRLRPGLPVLLSSDSLDEELRGIADADCVAGIVRKPNFMTELGEALGHALLFPV